MTTTPLTPAQQTKKDQADLKNRLAHHPPASEDHAKLHENMRAKATTLGNHIIKTLPPSRERSLALTHLQEALMWSNAAIAYGPDPLDQ